MSAWIAVSERHPEPNVCVLVTPGYAGRIVDIEEWCSTTRCFLMEIETGQRVTHWMPLPEPPVEIVKGTTDG